MIKTLRKLNKQDKEKFFIPRTIQQAIPANRIWLDGIFLVGKDQYSKTFQFEDINYAVASRETQESMFLDYSELLNSLDSAATTKITINNRKLNRKEFEKTILIPFREDGLDIYRKEYNDMLLQKAEGASGRVQEKYITITVYKSSVDDARSYFNRIGADIASYFAKLGSKCTPVEAIDKLRILHDFYRPGEETNFEFDLQDAMRKGHSYKDYICPDSLDPVTDHIQLGDKFGRVLFFKSYATFIKDDMVAEMTDIDRNMMFSIDIIPIPLEEAIKEVETRLLGVETNITNWQRKQNQNNNFSAVIPYDMEQQRKESKEFLHDLSSRDQKMMIAVVTVVHTADTLEQLDHDSETIIAAGQKHMCQFATLKHQQLDGLNTALPIGVRKVEAMRTLTTESLAVLMPFQVREIMDKGGVYFGENAVSKNLIMCNKSKLLNPNAFLLGVPGSGKSFSAKELITFIALATDDDILICDPEREYASLVDAMGGEVIRIAAGSNDHINAMDMVEGYGDGGNPVIDKSEFILSLFEQLDAEKMGARQKSIIDRCTATVYDNYQRVGQFPTLPVLREVLMQQPEEEARDLALSLELFTHGSLNAFAHPTNVNINNRMVVYDIMDLGKQLKTMGLLVITDAMINRVTENWKKGKRTHIILDEFHVVFENEYSGAFFNNAWRRFRKRGGFPTAITQNVEYLLDSVLASSMLSNSEFMVLLNQAASDRERLKELLNISEDQMHHITNADAGCGLIKYGSSLLPFENKFPTDTKLYKLMTTKPSDSWQ